MSSAFYVAHSGDGGRYLMYRMTHSALGSRIFHLSMIHPHEVHLDRGRFRLFSVNPQAHEVEVSFSFYENDFGEMLDWIGENISAPWSFSANIRPSPPYTSTVVIGFRETYDAIAFKLRWNND